MKVTNFKVRKLKRKTIFLANFSFRKKEFDQKLWFEIPSQYSRQTNFYDSFFVAAVPLALALGEDLYFEGTVSKKLYKNLSQVDDYFQLSYRKIKILVLDQIKRKKKGKGVGLFFSLGVDSYYALLKKNSLLNYLIFIDGLETFKTSRKLVEKVKTGVRFVAKKFKKTPIFTKTNIRTLSDKIINWELYHGAAIASVGLFLSAFLKKIYISSCDQYLIKDKVYGTSEEIDYRWSTEALLFESQAPDINKASKLIELSESDYISIIKKYLWVCWENIDKNKEVFNCSKCEKCIRVYLGLRAGGVKDLIPSLKKPKIDEIKKIKIVNDRLVTYLTIFNRLKLNKNEDKKIINALAYALTNRGKDLFFEYLNTKLLKIKTNFKKICKKFATMLYDRLTNQYDHF